MGSTNPLNCAFKLSTLGTRGTAPASWSQSTDGSCITAQTISEVGGTNTNKWRNIGNGGTFTWQLTSAGGPSGGAAPFTYAPTTGHPDLLSTVPDNGLTWTNTGAMIQPVWRSFAGISKNSNRFCSAFSSNSYGHGTGTYNNDNADQGTGIYVECYDFSTNVFVLLNTITGIQSTVTCSGDPHYNCPLPGVQSKLTAQGTPYSAITSNCTFPVHNAKGGSTLDYVVIAQQLPVYGGSCSAQNLLDWQPFATFDSTNNLQIYNGVSNHWTIGKQVFINVGDQSVVGYTSGSYTDWFDSASPRNTPLSTWQVGTPQNPCEVHGTWKPKDLNPPCDFGDAYDSHMAYWHDPLDDDLGPICGSIFNYATLAPPPVAPYQGEEICVSTTPTWTVGGTIGAYKVWRFTHSFATGGSPDFSAQFAISQLSTDGNFLAFTSDWNCTLGNLSGQTSPLYCGAPWVGGTNYVTGTMINPFSSTGGSGKNFGVWQVQAPGGVGSTTQPNWVVCSAANKDAIVTDPSNIFTYKCLGSGNGKGEVFIVKLN